jgi:hypothetical protein
VIKWCDSSLDIACHGYQELLELNPTMKDFRRLKSEEFVWSTRDLAMNLTKGFILNTN